METQPISDAALTALIKFNEDIIDLSPARAYYRLLAIIDEYDLHIDHKVVDFNVKWELIKVIKSLIVEIESAKKPEL